MRNWRFARRSGHHVGDEKPRGGEHAAHDGEEREAFEGGMVFGGGIHGGVLVKGFVLELRGYYHNYSMVQLLFATFLIFSQNHRSEPGNPLRPSTHFLRNAAEIAQQTAILRGAGTAEKARTRQKVVGMPPRACSYLRTPKP
jgi:hypothetical protein